MPHFLLRGGEMQFVSRLPVEAGDRGLLYGFSLFETMLVRNGRVIMLHSHLDRLTRSARELGMQFLGDAGKNPAAVIKSRDSGEPSPCRILVGKCAEALERCGVADGVLRLTVTAGPAEDGEGVVLFSVREGLPYRAEQYEKGLSLLVLDFPRNERSPLVGHKTANYLENLLGRREAVRRGYDEGLFLNTGGSVAEGTVSNIFIVRQGELFTPPPEAGLLPGTVRRLVLQRAGREGYRCREANFNLEDLMRAEECFLTNSLMGVMPVTGIDGYPVGAGKPGPVTEKIMRVYPPQ